MILTEGARVRLRMMRWEDADELYALLSDEAVMRWLEPPFSRAQAERFLEQAGLSEPPLVYAAESSEGEFLGYAIYHGFQSFCDSRADLFPEDALDASIQLAFSSGTTDTTYRDALSKWDFDAVLLSKESNAPAIEFMEVLPGWEKTIENDYYVIFTPQ